MMASRGYFSSLTKDDEDNALLNKLAVPESSYNRLSTLLARLNQTTSADELITLQSELDEEFVNFELATIKAQNIRNANEKEIQRYNAEKQVILEKSNQAQQDITSLREELREAKLERGQKVQYDEFTRSILKKTPKSRAEQTAGIAKIASELEELNSELSSYSTVWDARKRTFDNILNNLEVLRREVEDEKEEQDRKEGMDEGSDHEEEEGQITGSQTPAIKDLEERRTREQSRDSGEVDEDANEHLVHSLAKASDSPGSKSSSLEVEMEDAEDEDEAKMVPGETKMEVD